MKAADWVLDQPWMITEEALGTILAVAERRNESPEAVEARLGRPLDNAQSVTVRDGVALIPVVGPIARYADFFTEISGATAIDTLAKDFRAALDDRSIKGIVLNMDTPGGTVSGVAEFAGHVRAARGVKPVVAYVGSRAQSAGYWIASAADRIVADPTAMLGSIGVVMGVRAKTGNERTIEFVSSQSPHKRADPTTETGRAQIQATTDDLADVFVDAVADNRDVPRQSVLDDFGRGGSLVGGKAVAAGMADSLGSLEGVISCLSRGEMPCPSRPKKAAPKKADLSPRRAAMSEPTQTETVADAQSGAPVISAAELDQLRKQAARAVAAEARADAEARLRIESAADHFVSTMAAGKDARLTPAQANDARADFILAATDDHDRPIAGNPKARQEALERAYKTRKPHGLTVEVATGDPALKGRALASDPAADTTEADPKAQELDEFGKKTEKYARSLNGSK